MTDTTPTGLAPVETDRLEVWTRADPSRYGRRIIAEKRAAFETLAETDVVGEIAVRDWGRSVQFSGRVPPSDGTVRVRDRVRDMLAWATDTDRSLAPAFECRPLPSSGTDPLGIEVRLPILCVAAHAEGRLQSVFPHRDGDRVYTVDDCLDSYRAATEARPSTPEVVSE